VSAAFVDGDDLLGPVPRLELVDEADVDDPESAGTSGRSSVEVQPGAAPRGWEMTGAADVASLNDVSG